MSSAFIPLSRRADKWHSRAPELYPVWSIDGITQWKRLLYIYIYICILCVAVRRSREWLLWSDEEWPRRRICSSRNRQRGLLLMLLLLLFFFLFFFIISLSLFFFLFFFFVFFSRGQWSSDDRWIASLGNLHVRFCFFERIGNELVWSCIVERAVHNDSFILCEYRKKKKMKVYKRI